MPWYTTGSALLYHGRCARSLMRGSLLYQRQPLVDHGRCLHRPQRLPLLYNGLCLDRPRRQPPVDDGRWLGRPRAVPCSTTGVLSVDHCRSRVGRSWAVPCSTTGGALPWYALWFLSRSITVAHGERTRSLMGCALLYQRQPLVDHGRCLGRPRALPFSTTGGALGRSRSLMGGSFLYQRQPWSITGDALIDRSDCPWYPTGYALVDHG